MYNERKTSFRNHPPPFGHPGHPPCFDQFQSSNGISFHINRMRHHQQAVVLFITLINSQHLLGRFWTNGRARREKEIYYINLICKSFIRNNLTILVYKSKIGNSWIDGIAIYYIPFAEYWKALGLLLAGRKGNYDRNQTDKFSHGFLRFAF